MLGPLQNNGGPTFTHELLTGSPAIDTGNPSFTPPPANDQRGPLMCASLTGASISGHWRCSPHRPHPPLHLPQLHAYFHTNGNGDRDSNGDRFAARDYNSNSDANCDGDRFSAADSDPNAQSNRYPFAESSSGVEPLDAHASADRR